MKPKGLSQNLLGTSTLTAALALGFAASSASAGTNWLGVNTDWNDPANWGGAMYATGNGITINTSTGNIATITANPTINPGDIFVGQVGTTGRLDIRAGLLRNNVIGTSGNWNFIGTGGTTANGTVNVADTSVTGQSNLTTFGQGSGSYTGGKFWIGGRDGTAGGTGVMNINTTGTINAQSTDNFGTLAAANSQAASIILGTGATGNGTVRMDSGTVNSTSAIWVGNNGGTGLWNQAGGTTNTSSLTIARWAGTGTVHVNGGTFNATGVNTRTGVGGGGSDINGGDVSVVVSRGASGSSTQQGTLNIGGTGTFNSTNDFLIGFAGGATSFGEVNVNAGGTLNVGVGGERWLIMNRYDTVQGRMTVDGGTLNILNGSDLRFSTGGGTGTSFATVKNGGSITGNAGSVLDLNRAGGTVNNTFNLEGGTSAGTLTIGAIDSTNVTGTRVFNFNGGTLKAAGTNANFFNAGEASAANVKAGGALINSNGFNVTIGQVLQHDAALGATPDGGLAKSGTGTLTLSGVNTYTGATAVNGGTLEVGTAGSINTTSGITINGSGAKYLHTSSVAGTQAITLTNGTLDGTGTVGAVTVGAGTGGVVANGNGGTGVLTLGSLTFSGAGGLNLNLANTTAGGLAVTGAVTTGADNSVTVNTVNLLTLGTTYNLVSAADFSGSDLTDYIYGGNTARKLGTFGFSGGFLNLTVNGDTPKWTGLDGGNWVVGTTGGNSNWKLVNAATATDYITNDDVLFDDSAIGSTTINISGGVVNPNSVVFNNSTLAYSIGGSGIADGTAPTALIKNGTAKATLTNTNTYTGATTINAGTLELGDGTTDGSIATTSGVTNNGTLAYNLAGDQTVGYAISGTGAVTKAGAGTLTMGSQAYTGGTTINGGTVKITTTSGAANTGTFNLGGGTFLVDLGAGTNFGYAPAINLTANSTFGNAATGSTANLQGQINYTGALDGNGYALNIANSGSARLYMNGTLTDVSQINVQSGAMGFDINNINNRGTAAVDVANGAALWFAGNNANPIVNALTFHGGNGIGGLGALYYEGGTATPAPLTGAITLDSGTTGIGTAFAADTITLNGDVSGAGGLNLIKGKLTLAGTNSYTGSTTVATGTTLTLSGAANQELSGAVTSTGSLIKSGAGTLTLSNSGNAIGGSLAVNGGTLALSGSGNTLTSSLTLNNGATLDLNNDLGLGNAVLINGTSGTINATGGGQIKLNTVGGDVGVSNGNTLTINAVIADGTSNNIDFWNTANGTGVVVLGGTNTYTGVSSLQSGVVSVSTIGNTGDAGNLGTNGTINMGVSGWDGSTATLRYTGAGETTDRTINLVGTNIGGTIEANGSGTLNVGGGVTASGTGNMTLNLTGSGNGEISGAIANPGTGAVAVTKAGGGTWTLSGANTYTGLTSVNAGTLINNGTILGDLSVADGATLAGSGTFGGTVTITGTLAVGNSPGLSTFGNLVLGETSTSVFEIWGTDRGINPGYDAADITGTLVYGGDLSITFDGGSYDVVGGESFNLFGFTTGNDSGAFSTVLITGNGFTSGGALLDGDLDGIWTGVIDDLNWSFTESTGTLAIQPIPEPSTYGLGLGVLALGLVLHRRRKQKL